MGKTQIPKYKTQVFFKKKNKYCICVPVINEGKRIQKQLQRMNKYSKIADIVVIDGGSTDGSTNKQFLKKQGVRAKIQSPLGQSIQLRAGLSWTLKEGYKGIIIIDGNGKDDIKAIPRFMEALDKGFDYTQGSRFIKGGKHEHSPKDRVFFNRFAISPLLSLAARKWYTDTPNAFRAYSRKYLLHPKVQPFRNIFQRYELLFYLTTRANRLGLKTKEIPVSRSYPKGKVPTKIVGWKKALDMLNILKISLCLYNPRPNSSKMS